MKNLDAIQMAFAGSATFLTALLGGWDKAIQILMILVVIDIISGSIIGFIFEKNFSSRRLREGLVTKIGYFIVIMIANLFDQLIPEQLPLLRTITVYAYIYVEGSSALENLARMGVPIPQEIVDRLASVKRKGGSKATLDENGKLVATNEKLQTENQEPRG